jgi:hypothetical protein
MKSKLYVFGDSNSALNRDLINSTNDYKNYLDLLGEDFKTWSELLSEKINFELHNYALIGGSNYSIFERFCENYKNIQRGDVVIINWSVTNRFRVGNQNKFLEILPQWISGEEFKKTKMYDELISMDMTIESLEMIGINRFDNEKLFQEEVNKWSYFIRDYCKLCGSMVLFWGICEHQDYFCINGQEYVKSHNGTIYQETKHKIGDPHFGKTGHEVFTNKMYELLLKECLIY